MKPSSPRLFFIGGAFDYLFSGSACYSSVEAFFFLSYFNMSICASKKLSLLYILPNLLMYNVHRIPLKLFLCLEAW